MTNRQRFAPIIARVICDHAGATVTEIRRALRAEYPDPERRGSRYKAWLKESRAQLGKAPAPRDRGRPPAKPPRAFIADPRQRVLFPNSAPPEIQFIESVIRAGAAGKSPATIHRAAPHIIGYRQAVRILDLHSQGKTAEQIARYLIAESKAEIPPSKPRTERRAATREASTLIDTDRTGTRSQAREKATPPRLPSADIRQGNQSTTQ